MRAIGIATTPLLAAVLCATSAFAQISATATPNGDALWLAATDSPVSTVSLPDLRDNPPLSFRTDRRYVVQLNGPVTPGLRATLADAGVQLGNYLPDHAYIVDLSDVAPSALADLAGIAWVGEYKNDWKLSPVIGLREQNRPYEMVDRVEAFKQGEVFVDITLFEGMDTDTAVTKIEQLGALVYRVDRAGVNMELTALLALIDVPLLAEIAAVQWVEEAPDVSYRNSTVRWIAQSNINGDTPIHDEGIHGEGQVVGILDGKIDVNHCSFSDGNPIGPTHRKILAYNTSLGTDFHGTHVAGIAVGDNGVNNDTRGMAYGGKLVFDTVPSFSNTAVYNALQLHHDQGARVHTNSWGNDGTTSYDGLARGIDRFMYDNEESLAVWAVTNTGSLKNPENAKNLLAVGATNDTPSQNSHCTGGAGPTSDGRRKPEVYLPGCGIQSANDNTSCSLTSLSGTSMASPAVAGTAMLVRQYYMDGFYPSGAAVGGDSFAPSAALLKATLVNCSLDMTGVSGYPSNTEGWGRIKLDRALFFPGELRGLLIDDVFNSAGLSTTESSEVAFELGSSLNLFVTLVWTEPAAAAGSGSPSINNLDLEVEDSLGNIYKGNVFSSGSSTTGGSADTINNVEQVHVNGPMTGAWTARVTGTAVNQGPQGYALVISGEFGGTPDPCPTDLNEDGTVNITDLGIILANFGATGVTKADGDADGDGDVDITDLGLILADFGTSCP